MERPFFYRLTDPRPLAVTSDLDTIKRTVVEELNRIVTTRNNDPQFGDRNLFNYGVPNAVDSYNESPDLQKYALQIREAIEAFEPRLQNIRVEIMGVSKAGSRSIRVYADLIYDGEVEKFSAHF